MRLQKTHLFVGAFLVFWIIFLGWGMFKTAFKLSKEKAAAPEITSPAITKESAPKTAKTEGQAAQPTQELQAPAAEVRPILVRVFKAKASNFQDVLPVMGTIKGKTEVALRFEIPGVIQTIHFKEGEKIKKGDMIISLDPKDAQLRAAYAKNKFNSAQSAYNSILKKLEVHKKLFEAGAILKSKLEEIELETESARFQVETAKNETELAANELAKTSIYANKDGVMGPRKKEEGEFVTPQDQVSSLLETSEVLVEVGVVERDIDKVKLGQKARVFVDAYPTISFEGIVDSIYPIVEGKSRTLTVKLKVANPEGLLFPGMFSRAEVSIISLKNAIIVPVTSLISGGKGVSLAPVIPAKSIEKTEDESQIGVVQLRRVNLGYVTSDYAQITQGVNIDDFIVLEAQGELKDNARVKIVGIEELSLQ